MSNFPTWEALLLLIPALLVGFTVHEYMHARVADALGDPTARLAGRVTFNPIKHLDPLGTIVLLVTQRFGWAKPVPINPNRFRNPKWDTVWVSLAGPGGNLLAAVAFGLAYKYFAPTAQASVSGLTLFLWQGVAMVVLINLFLMVFNLIPIPPLDGSKVLPLFLPDRYMSTWYKVEQYGIFILIGVLFLAPGLFRELIVPPVAFILGLMGLQGLF